MDLTRVDLKDILPPADIIESNGMYRTKPFCNCLECCCFKTDGSHRWFEIIGKNARLIISAKSTLAARIDSIRGDPTGKAGHSLLEEICKKIEKLQELPPAKILKPLPVPDCMPKKKRGGRRLRKLKETYAQSDMMKLANRMQFGGKVMACLDRQEVGNYVSYLAKADMLLRFNARSCGRSESRSGLTSSLAFTPVQGMGLSNPLVHNHHSVSGTQSTYFSDVGTFSNIKGKDAIPIFTVIRNSESSTSP
uniref:Prp31 C-terminal domain-containing protein n=1 Tax=Oryza punctata TaxID=4537 RepID=A0A0E0K4U1_ORYPU